MLVFEEKGEERRGEVGGKEREGKGVRYLCCLLSKHQTIRSGRSRWPG